MPSFLLAWERLLWSGRPGLLTLWRSFWLRYYVTDCRIVVATRWGRLLKEILLDDIGGVELRQNRAERLAGASTVVVRSRRAGDPPVEFLDIGQGPQLALVLQLLVADRFGLEPEAEFFREALSRRGPGLLQPDIAKPFSLAAALLAAIVVALGISGASDTPSPVLYAARDAIAPGGVKRDRAAIMAFMQNEVMPVARRILAPIKGGPERVTCETCHGLDASMRDWRMPAVRALPEPQFRLAGLERYNRRLDPQIRNAIYGYLAEEDKQSRAAYMRSSVMPEMARLLGRPAYDFTQSYEYNRVRAAVGCYHCHHVEAITTGSR